MLCARRMRAGPKFQIRRLNDENICAKQTKLRWATFKWIGDEYLETIRSQPNIARVALVDQIPQILSPHYLIPQIMYRSCGQSQSLPIHSQTLSQSKDYLHSHYAYYNKHYFLASHHFSLLQFL